MLTPGQRRNKLKSRVALLSSKMNVVKDAESTLASIQELRTEAARLQSIADKRESNLHQYATEYPDMLKQRRFCRELRSKIKEFPEAKINVLEYMVSQELGYTMRFDDILQWYD